MSDRRITTGQRRDFQRTIADLVDEPTAPRPERDVVTVTVELNLDDALMAGLSMQVFATRIPDPNTQAIYKRVGAQLVDTARAKALVPR